MLAAYVPANFPTVLPSTFRTPTDSPPARAHLTWNRVPSSRPSSRSTLPSAAITRAAPRRSAVRGGGSGPMEVAPSTRGRWNGAMGWRGEAGEQARIERHEARDQRGGRGAESHSPPVNPSPLRWLIPPAASVVVGASRSATAGLV